MCVNVTRNVHRQVQDVNEPLGMNLAVAQPHAEGFEGFTEGEVMSYLTGTFAG